MAKTLTTPEGRLSYMKLYHPEENLQHKIVYSTNILFPKEADISGIKKVLAEIFEEEKDRKFKGYSNNKLSLCFKDGDEYYQEKPEKREAYIGTYFITASKDPKKGAPQVLDENGMATDNPAVFDSGDWGICRLNFWAYNNVNVGIGCTVLGARKTRAGERFGGGESADDTLDALGGMAVPGKEVNTPDYDDDDDGLI